MTTAAVPPLSVVMPVLDGGPYLDASIASILGQTFGDFEFVILDDGSTDGSTERLRSWAAKDRRIRLIEGGIRTGPVASSNRVVAESRAPLVARMDADDVARPDRLRLQIEAMRAHPDAVLVGALSATIDARGRRVRPPDHARLARASRFAPFVHSSILVRRKAFDAAGGYRADSERWEDVDLFLRLAAHGRTLVVALPLLDYRLSDGSTRLSAQAALEEAMDRMHRAVDGRAARGGRLRPAAFVPGAAIHLWNGRAPRLTRRLWQRAGLSFDRETARMLAWAAWADLSPRSLRAFQRALLRLSNRAARKRLGGRELLEWRPGEPPRPALSAAETTSAAP